MAATQIVQIFYPGDLDARPLDGTQRHIQFPQSFSPAAAAPHFPPDGIVGFEFPRKNSYLGKFGVARPHEQLSYGIALGRNG